jgi:hypothetical protein
MMGADEYMYGTSYKHSILKLGNMPAGNSAPKRIRMMPSLASLTGWMIMLKAKA